MTVRAVSDMTFWSALAGRCLGNNQQAAEMFNGLLDYSQQLEQQDPKIDYFATSLPAMLLFEDDLKKRNQIEALFLRGQALFGQGNQQQAERLLKEVLQLDSNHPGALDLLRNAEVLRSIKQLG